MLCSLPLWRSITWTNMSAGWDYTPEHGDLGATAVLRLCIPTSAGGHGALPRVRLCKSRQAASVSIHQLEHILMTAANRTQASSDGLVSSSQRCLTPRWWLASCGGNATGTMLPARHGCMKRQPTCQSQAALTGMQDAAHEPSNCECARRLGAQQQRVASHGYWPVQQTTQGPHTLLANQARGSPAAEMASSMTDTAGSVSQVVASTASSSVAAGRYSRNLAGFSCSAPSKSWPRLYCASGDRDPAAGMQAELVTGDPRGVRATPSSAAPTDTDVCSKVTSSWTSRYCLDSCLSLLCTK